MWPCQTRGYDKRYVSGRKKKPNVRVFGLVLIPLRVIILEIEMPDTIHIRRLKPNHHSPKDLKQGGEAFESDNGAIGAMAQYSQPK